MEAAQSADPQSLAHWGLPAPVLAAFHKKGLKRLYKWQAVALECAEAGNNLVYCAPTSGGKSLIAEILMLARLHKTTPPRSKHSKQQAPTTRALLVLPYLSIVSEKAAHLGKLLADMKWRVQGYQGENEGQPLVHKAERIAICSIEKANAAINRLIQEQRMNQLVSVVIDEAHMLADPHRGPCLEMLLSKLVACKSSCNVQIVAMSATMTGLDSFSAWLDAHLFLTNFRPVPLTEHAVFAGAVYVKAANASASSNHIANIDGNHIDGNISGANSNCPLVEQRRLPVSGTTDRESLLVLVTEVVKEHHSVLVFCGGRAAAQSCAGLLADQLHRYVGPPSEAQVAARTDLVERLKVALAGNLNAELERLVAAGVAYHHAGLTHQERSLIEEGYCSGALLVLTATSTLAAGVNLPARRVILRSLWQGAGNVSRAQYLQMVGRAGRAGQSSVGESFLMGQGAAGSMGGQFGAVCQLMSAPLPVLSSRLLTPDHPGAQLRQQAPRSSRANSASSSAAGGAASGGSAARSGRPAATVTASAAARAQPMLQHLLLDGIATGLVTTGESVLHLLQSTLAFRQVVFDTLADAARTALAGLRARRLISLKPQTATSPSHWELTHLGSAVVASTLSPELGLLLHGRLSDLLSCLVLGGHIHLMYALQPDPLVTIFDWSQWQRLFRDLHETHRRVAEVEGIDEQYIDRRIAGARGDAGTDARHFRFAAAVLLDLLVADAARVHQLEEAWGQPNTLTKNGITRGQMQNWQLEMSKTAAMAALLASNAGWWQLETLLAPLSAQAAAGVKPQLLPLMQVPGMQPAHAAALFKAGFERPELLVCASEGEVAAALAAGLPANMRKRKNMDKKGVAIGLTGSGSTNAVVSRAARAILAGARQHAVDLATAGSLEDSDTTAGTQPRVVRKTIVGQAVVHLVSPKREEPLLQQLLDTWLLQPSFTFAVVLHPTQCSMPGCSISSTAGRPCGGEGCSLPNCSEVHCPKLAALALCWSDREAAVLQLPPIRPPLQAAGKAGAPANAPAEVAAQVWNVVRAVFGDASRTATCCGAAEALAALQQAAGIECSVTVDDPLQALMRWQPAAYDQHLKELQQQQQRHQVQAGQQDSGQGQLQRLQQADLLRMAQGIVLGDSFKLQAQLLANPAQTDAVRAVLLGRQLMPPLRAVLAQQQLAEAYERVDRPLQRAAASVQSNGIRVPLQQVQQLLQQCQWQRQALQRQVTYLTGDDAATRVLDISRRSDVVALLSRLRLGGSHSEQQGVPALLLKAIREALQQQQQQQRLPLLQCLLGYWRISAFECSLHALQQLAGSSSGSGGAAPDCTEVAAAGCLVLQLQPKVTSLCADISFGLPAGLELVLAHVALPVQPVLVLSTVEVSGVPAPIAAAQVAIAGQAGPAQPLQQQQQQQFKHLGTLCSLISIAGATSTARGSRFDQDADKQLAGKHKGAATVACVRHWCSTTGCVREEQLCASLLHITQQLTPATDALQRQLASEGSSMTGSTGSYQQAFLSGSMSLLGCIRPSHDGCIFVGLLLELLPLAVLAGMSRDAVLCAALCQADPLAVGAAHWLQNGGISPQDASLLLSRVQAGSLDGVPVTADAAPGVLFNAAVHALVGGQKPSVQRSMLGVEQKLNLQEPLMKAFPAVQEWQQLALEQCRENGYLQTCLGRRIPCKLLPAEAASSKGSATRQQREAERTATSALLLACCGDIEQLAVAALQHCCQQFSASIVLCGARQVIVQVPSAAAMSLLTQAARHVMQEVCDVLPGLSEVHRGLPFKWWWGSSLDALMADTIVSCYDG